MYFRHAWKNPRDNGPRKLKKVFAKRKLTLRCSYCSFCKIHFGTVYICGREFPDQSIPGHLRAMTLTIVFSGVFVGCLFLFQVLFFFFLDCVLYSEFGNFFLLNGYWKFNMFKIKDQTGKRDNKRQSIATGFENLWLVISLFGLCKFMKKKFFPQLTHVLRFYSFLNMFNQIVNFFIYLKLFFLFVFCFCLFISFFANIAP